MAVPVAATRSRAESGSPLTVLVVNDAAPAGRQLVDLLGTVYEVLQVSTTDAAVSTLGSHHVDLVVTDQRAGRGDDDMLARLHHHDPAVLSLRIPPFPDTNPVAGVAPGHGLLAPVPDAARWRDEEVLAAVRRSVVTHGHVGLREPEPEVPVDVPGGPEDVPPWAQFVPDGVVGIGAQGLVTYVNPQTVSMLGRTAAELIGTTQDDLFRTASSTPTPLVSQLETALRSGAAVRQISALCVRGDGSTFPVEVAIGPVVVAEQLVGAVLTFRDVSARIAVQRMKDEFVSVVSHELRTPLAAIRAPLMMLAAGKGGTLSDRGMRMTSLALESGLRLSRLIENLLDIEAMQSGTLTVAPVNCDAAAVVRTAVDEIVVVALAQGVTIETRGESVNIYADPERIVVVLRNLLENAIRFSPADSTITISIAARDDTVEFAVADRGSGIPEDKTAVIFGSFEQVDSSDSRAHAGIGLGLTICRNIVRMHGGQIWVYSTPGVGSTFHFTLPRQPPTSRRTDRPTRRVETVTSAAAEAARLEALNSLAVLDTPREDRFDRVVRVALRLFGVPMVGVSLIGSDRQWHKAAAGLAEEGSRDDAFCSHTIRQSGPLVVEDATLDDRFKNNPLVTGGPAIRFYAGQPLRSPGGHRVGALCVIDTSPRQISLADLELLRDLADWVEKELAGDTALANARDVRTALKTSPAPTVRGYEVAGRCVPALQVGGHFFDHYLMGDRIHLSLVEVTGHGTGAAVLAASTRAYLRGYSRSADVAETVDLSAASLSPDLISTAGSLTLLQATLEPTSGLMTYVDAGHELVGIFEQTGTVRQLEPPGPPLTHDPAGSWQAHTTVLAPGETLLAVSKGLLSYFATPMEAMVSVVELVRKATSAAELVDLVCGLSAGHPVSDQLTCLVVQRSLSAQQTVA